MGTTGVIFGLIAIGWLAYLVPHFVRRREGDPIVAAADPADRFSGSVRIVRHGTAPLLNQDLEAIGDYEVSTPQTRRAAIRELRRLDKQAADRRRRVLLGLLAVTSLVVVLCGARLLPAWIAAVPGGLLLAFVVVSRVSVQRLRSGLDARYASIAAGNNEKTVLLSRSETVKAVGVLASASGPGAVSEKSVPLSVGGLWDPVPITMPTYVSKPLAPRTVRTIDLSGLDAAQPARQSLPVTADAPVVDEPAAREVSIGRDEDQAASA